MPGIFGIITSLPREQAEADLQRMSEFMRSEPFYVRGTRAFDSMGVYVGWTAIEGAYADCMPALNETKDKVLIFAGEHFADKEEIAALKRRNHAIRKPDASYLVHLYEELGDQLPAALNGAFAGLAIDLKARSGILFNDRFGAHRLYWARNARGFYFASEALPVLRLAIDAPASDLESLSDWAVGNPLAPGRSMFHGLSTALPGSLWRLSASGPGERESYFSSSTWEALPYLGNEYFLHKYDEILTRILPAYSRVEGDRPAGVALHADVGPRLLVARAQWAHGRYPCRTFHVSASPGGEPDDLASLAAAAGQPYERLGLSPDFAPNFPALAEQAAVAADGQPCIEDACLLDLAAQARKIAPSWIAGVFWREPLLARDAAPNRSLLPALDPSLTRSGDTARVGNAPDAEHPATNALFRWLPGFAAARLAPARVHLSLRLPFLDQELATLVFRLPLDGTARARVVKGLASLAASQAREGTSSEKSRKEVWLSLLKRLATPRARRGTDSAPSASAGLVASPAGLSPADVLPAAAGYPRIAEFVREVLSDPWTLQSQHVDRNGLQRLLTDYARGAVQHFEPLSRLAMLELARRRFLSAS